MASSDEFSSCKEIMDKSELTPGLQYDGKKPWKRTIPERIAAARHHKDCGLKYFKETDFRKAAYEYSQALKCLIPILSPSKEELKDIEDLKLACYANLAACQLKLKQYDYAVVNSSKALGLAPKHVKSLYRRALGFIETNEFDKAKDDIEQGLQLEPANKSFKDLSAKLKVKIKHQNDKYASMMAKYLQGESKAG